MPTDMAVTKERVAEQLKGLRELHGRPGKLLSVEKAAAEAGLSSREWQRLEKREIKAPRADTLSKIADAYKVPLEVFDNGRPEKNSTPLAERLDEIDRKLSDLDEKLEELLRRTAPPQEPPDTGPPDEERPPHPPSSPIPPTPKPDPEDTGEEETGS